MNVKYKIEKAKTEGSVELDLSYNQLTVIPEGINELINLHKLNLCGNRLTELPEEIVKISNLQELDVSCNQLKCLPTKFKKLNNLRILNLTGNKITIFPKEIKELNNLQELYLSNNQLTIIPGWIGDLVNLQRLYIRSNKLESLPEGIKKLNKLNLLASSSNYLVGLPLRFRELANLQRLDLSGNRLTKIPEEIRYLPNLIMLDLGNNELKELPEWVGELNHLKVLDLNCNHITIIPGWIGELTNLECLYLSDNNLTNLSVTIKELRNLQVLDLKKNQISSLPEWIGKLSALDTLYLNGNPLVSPPLEIVDKGIYAIKNYLVQLEKASKRLYEAKLILVGQGGVGKTSLSKKIINMNAELDSTEKTTRGIDIKQFTFEYDQKNDFKVNVWDFGGQVIYHATHQFFLTKRSLYVFIWEVRREEEELQGFYYWLNIIRLLSNNSPIIVVLNKIDERRKEINQASYKSEFDNIIKFIQVSCENNENIPELLKIIKEEIVKLPQVGTVWPEVWTKIRTRLEKDKCDYINYSEYLKICQENSLDEKDANYLTDFLHDLGGILHFQDDEILRNIVILKPEWGTNAVYKVLDTPKIQKNNGRFNIKDLDEIWGDSKYPRDKYPELLQLMLKFELCFRLLDTKEYIIPELLSPQKPPYEWNYSHNLRFEYQYKFMPAGIITRFIVRQHQKIEGDCYWKNGVILRYDGTKALIESDPLQRKIKIIIDGFDKKGLLAIIRGELQNIHISLNNPEVIEMLPCVCPLCKEANEPFSFDYETLKRFIMRNKKTIPCNLSTEDVAIEQLLNGIEVGYAEVVVKYTNNITIMIDSLVVNNNYYQEIKRLIDEHAPIDEREELHRSLEMLKRSDGDKVEKNQAKGFLMKFLYELVKAGKTVAVEVIKEAILKGTGLG